MELIAPKCHVLTVTRRKTGVVFRYSINNEALDSVQSIRDLGVVIDKSLFFTEHYSGVITRASKMLGYIKRTATNFSNPRALTVLYTALVRPHLEYASPIWSPGARTHVNRAGAVQRRFLRFAAFRLGMGMNISDHDYTKITIKLNIPSLETQRTVADLLLLLYKVLNYIVDSPGLLETIRLRIPRVNSRQSEIFYVPHYRTNVVRNSWHPRTLSYANRFLNEGADSVDFFSSSMGACTTANCKLAPRVIN